MNLQAAIELLGRRGQQVTVKPVLGQVQIIVSYVDQLKTAQYHQTLPFDHMDTKLPQCIVWCSDKLITSNPA